MSDEVTEKDFVNEPEEAAPKPEIEPLADADLESVAGGYCSAAACSGAEK